MPGYQVPLTTVDANTTINNQKLITTGNDIGKNYIINGGFDVWQRGNSVSIAQGYCGPDRWRADFAVAVILGTWERGTFAPGQTDVPGNPKYYWRINVTNTNGSGTMEPNTHIEDVSTLSGEVVTLSFWARINSGTRSIAWVARQNFGTGGSGSVDTTFGAANLTTAWQKFTFTITIPGISGKTVGADSSLRIFSTGYASSPSAYQIDYANIQLERGPNATPFSRAGGTIQGELSACQRYYWQTDSATSYFYSGFTYSSTIFFSQIPYPVTMRTSPSLLTTGSGSDYRILQGGSFIATSAPTLETSLKNVATLRYTGSGYTVGYGGAGSGNTSNSYLAFSSEI
jgi:hypothetical protein